MKWLRTILLATVVCVGMLTISGTARAQCAMCTLNADNSTQNGQTQGKGLNNGILFLLAAPYVAVAGVGYLWYKKYRRKNVNIRVKNEPISLN